VVEDQGDQIERNFAQWAIVYSGKFIENPRSGPHFCAALFQSMDYLF
jgi:hypothetical protein